MIPERNRIAFFTEHRTELNANGYFLTAPLSTDFETT